MLESNQGKCVRRMRRKRHVRKGVYGHAQRLRLTVCRSLKNISAQVIDDDRGVTLCQASSLDKELRGQIKSGGNKAGAQAVGEALAKRAVAKGIKSVCFDRNGYKFHGRVKSLADGAREGGLAF